MYGKYNQITATRRHCWIGFRYHCWIGYLLRWCWKIHLLEFLPLQQDAFHVHELPCHLFDLWRCEGNQPPLCLPTDYRIFFHVVSLRNLYKNMKLVSKGHAINNGSK